MAGHAADDAPAHGPVHAVHQRTTHHEEKSAGQDDQADDHVEETGEDVAQGYLKEEKEGTHFFLPFAAGASAGRGPALARVATAGRGPVARSILPSIRRMTEL